MQPISGVLPNDLDESVSTSTKFQVAQIFQTAGTPSAQLHALQAAFSTARVLDAQSKLDCSLQGCLARLSFFVTSLATISVIEMS